MATMAISECDYEVCAERSLDNLGQARNFGFVCVHSAFPLKFRDAEMSERVLFFA